jgi:hypothetical protein
MLIAARNALMAGKRLPYDAEVEYLESTGTQFLKTQVLLPASFIVKSTLISQNTQYGFVCGARNATTSGDRFTILANQTQHIGFDFGTSQARDIISVGNQKFVVEAVVENNKIQTFSAAGTTRSFSFTKSSTPYYLYIFECNTGNAETTFKGKYKMYSFSLFDTDANKMLIDLIPVRVGTTGAMYDRRGIGGMNPDGTARNDGLYFNRGTGNFGYGNDK